MKRSLVAPAAEGRQAHASTLLVTEHGALIAWFEGTREGAADTRIMVSRAQAGAEFGPPDVVGPAAVPHWNPVLAQGPDGAIWLFFKRGPRIDQWCTWYARSLNGGATWSAPRELVPGDESGGRGPVRQAPLLVDHRWLAPGSVEQWHPAQWDCFVDISDDLGRTWCRVMVPLDHAVVAGAGCIQPCLIRCADELVLLARSTAGAVFRAASTDGEVWSPLGPTTLPNNNSGLAAVALLDGRLLCVHNAASGNWAARDRLVVSASLDHGHTWRLATVIEEAAGQPEAEQGDDGAPSGAGPTGVVTSGNREFSYPSAQLVGDELWVTYTWQRRGIALARIPLAEWAAPVAS